MLTRRPVTSFLVCLCIVVAMAAASCSDDETSKEQSQDEVAGQNGKGGVSGVGGRTAGGATQRGGAGATTAGSNGDTGGHSAAGTASSSAGRSTSAASGDGGVTAGAIAGNAGAAFGAGGGGSGGTNAAGKTGIAGSAGALSCQLAPQSGCPGQACDLDYTRLSENKTICRPIVAAGTEADTCTTTSACAAGYLCLGGSCSRFCASDSHCAAPGGLCVRELLDSSSSLPVPGVAVCSKNCDPLTATGCPSGWGCGIYRDTQTQRAYADCSPLSGAAGTQGAACSTSADCASGYGCITVTTNGTTTATSCLAFCVPGSTTSQCPSNATCNAFNPAVTLGTTPYGICMN